MKTMSLLSCVLLLSSCNSSFAQEYSYTHYDIGDGLAGSVVYCITQDKDGFMWMGTETGVSRFDGTHFRTFTTSDGLPDLEVLDIFGDSKGRVWMAPFRKSVCYYYRGRIHNNDNDAVLRSIHLSENVESFAEDANGNILILEPTRLHWLGANGSVREIDSIGGHPLRHASAACRSASGHFLVVAGPQVFDLSDKGESLVYSFPFQDPTRSYIALSTGAIVYRADSLTTGIHSFVTGKTFYRHFERDHYIHLSYTISGDSLCFSNEWSGSTEFDLRTGRIKKFLPGREVSKTFRDAMGNTWFTTAGQGIYRLNSDEFRTIRFRSSGRETDVHGIIRFNDSLLVGDNNNYIHILSWPPMIPIGRFTVGEANGRNRILFIGRAPGWAYTGTDQWFKNAISVVPSELSILAAIKSIAKKSVNELYIATNFGVLLVDMRRFRIEDTLWRERSTAVYDQNDTVYIGTLNGLYQITPNRSTTYMGRTIPFLQKRISAIGGSPDGTLWFGSYDAGVIGYRGGHVIARLNRQDGLTSDICRTLLVDSNTLWIGTDKGLNKVRLDRRGYPVTRYTSNDGLGSDVINSIYLVGSIVYVGTTDGLSYFDQTKVNISQGCRLYLLSVFNSGKDRIGDSAHLVIPYQDKHIRFEFACISYRSVGDILYRYRVLGLETAWRETRESYLEYPILPSGKYVFQLQAVNKFGQHSALLSLPLEVTTPFWQTAWFYSLLIAGSLMMVWLLYTFQINRIRRRQEERERLNQRLLELENTALKSQMNPHFIFNCLNSIQQYIFDKEALVANKYLTGFAKLIRATLHNSSKAFISLAEEIDYLSTYLSLEKLRFKEKMEYAIDVDASIDRDLFVIPPMLIQPFVENSMRHGLRHKTEGRGFIHIDFSIGDDHLRIIVEDNGIGRKKASGYKTQEHIEYQSKGMSLTADRIRMMNVKYGNDIQVEVDDLEDDKGQATGTRVVLLFPLFHNIIQNQTI